MGLEHDDDYFECSVYDLYRGGDIDKRREYKFDVNYKLIGDGQSIHARHIAEHVDYLKRYGLDGEYCTKYDEYVHRADDVSGRPDDFIVGHLTSSDPGDID